MVFKEKRPTNRGNVVYLQQEENNGQNRKTRNTKAADLSNVYLPVNDNTRPNTE